MDECLCPKITLSFILIASSFFFMFPNRNLNSKKHIKIMRNTAAECALFLKKNEEFPIEKACNVLLIGSGARLTVKGGLGSADTETITYTTCEKGLEKAGFKITTKNWLEKYPHFKEDKLQEHMNYIKEIHEKNNISNIFRIIAFPEYEYDLKVTEEEEKADIAIYVLSRNSGEGFDRRLIKGDALLTDTEIKDILYLNHKFRKFILVLNVGGVVDLSPVKDVSNILLLSQLGEVTGDILADIILGKANPSGKLATTWAAIQDYKFISEFGDGNNTLYKEGVYVGYRYFDSAKVNPLFPFGYGLSYTSFKISYISLRNKKDEIFIKVKVKNIGKYHGKEVIQVYVSPPQENKDKPYQSLVSFKKTPLLKPNEEVEMRLHFKLRDVARYDEDIACYMLDKGKYIIRVGNSSRNTKAIGYAELNKDSLTKQLKNIDRKPGFNDYKPKIVLNDDISNLDKVIIGSDDFDFKRELYRYKYKINDKIKKLKDEELAYLCVGGYAEEGEFNEKERGLNGLTTNKVNQIKQYLKMCDGPTGLRLARAYNLDSKGYHRLTKSGNQLYRYSYLKNLSKIYLVQNDTKEDFSNYTNLIFQKPTALPIATALAQSFNVELVQLYGDIVGKEMEIYDIDILLGPAMNIHRNILCGRNFEYYSEDPFLTGKMAAAFIKGIQSNKNKGATIKHFTGYNQENNRLNSNSRISERALREIYMKGFQIAIEDAHPVALMTSYNLINGLHPSENYQLMISTLRNEWNFKGMIMTDWIRSGQSEYKTSIYPSQFVNATIKAGNNIIMPGSKRDYKLILQKLNEKELTRDDLLYCASKVYETIKLLKSHI